MASTAGADGFLTHVRLFGASVLGHVAMRIELLSIEVQEEKHRLTRLAMSAALASALLMVSLVMAAILIMAVYWDTPSRVSAALSLAGVFSALTVAAGLYVGAQLRVSSTLFTNSARELKRDADAMFPGPPPP
ncbi:MAG: phage holin family protein [Betaproteobacteria bacterium]